MDRSTRGTNNQHWPIFVMILQEIANYKKLSIQEIANRAGVQETTIKDFFSLQKSPTLDLFIQVSRSLEVNFFFEDRDSETDLSILFEQAMEKLGRRPDKLPKN